MVALFHRYLPQLETHNNPENLTLMLYILEEYLLLQMVQQLP